MSPPTGPPSERKDAERGSVLALSMQRLCAEEVDVRVANVMRTLFAVVSPDDSLQQAAVLMRDHGVGFLPVCDEEGRAVGVITDRDIVVRAAATDAPLTATLVREVMSRPVIACSATDELWVVERLMLEHHKSRIVCVDDTGIVVGVMSLLDVALNDDSRRTLEVLQHLAEREPNR